MTIYDIALEAGVSASTVSRVLNKKKGVSEENRKKIEILLRKYNFAPNASAQGLVSQSSKIIGIMMSDIRTSHHAEGAYFIEQQLQHYGYSCVIVNSGFSEESREEGMRLLASRRAEAVVLIGSTFQSENVKKNIEKYLSDLPIIIENGVIDLPNVYSVMADERSGIAECLQFLYDHGRSHPCFVNMHETPSNLLKIQGFVDTWRRHNPNTSAQPPVVHLSQQEDEEEWYTCHLATKKIMEEAPDIDALIFATDLLANAGTRALMESGIQIPQQVAVIGVDNSLYSKISYPRLTSLDNRMQELSITCSNILIRILNGENVPHLQIIHPHLVQRETT